MSPPTAAAGGPAEIPSWYGARGHRLRHLQGHPAPLPTLHLRPPQPLPQLHLPHCASLAKQQRERRRFLTPPHGGAAASSGKLLQKNLLLGSRMHGFSDSERRSWHKFGDALREDIGSRLTMVSTEEILLERPRAPGSGEIISPSLPLSLSLSLWMVSLTSDDVW
jgi:hypothetical protein